VTILGVTSKIHIVQGAMEVFTLPNQKDQTTFFLIFATGQHKNKKSV
jgi:hypothetical protein